MTDRRKAWGLNLDTPLCREPHPIRSASNQQHVDLLRWRYMHTHMLLNTLHLLPATHLLTLSVIAQFTASPLTQTGGSRVSHSAFPLNHSFRVYSEPPTHAAECRFSCGEMLQPQGEQLTYQLVQDIVHLRSSLRQSILVFFMLTIIGRRRAVRCCFWTHTGSCHHCSSSVIATSCCFPQDAVSCKLPEPSLSGGLTAKCALHFNSSQQWFHRFTSCLI